MVDSLPPGLLSYDHDGSFICATTACSSVSFVGDMVNIGGSEAPPTGFDYTFDGSLGRTGNIPAPTISGCTLSSVDVWKGDFALNAFRSSETLPGAVEPQGFRAVRADSRLFRQIESLTPRTNSGSMAKRVTSDSSAAPDGDSVACAAADRIGRRRVASLELLRKRPGRERTK